jgi:hypothetical protein
MSTVETNMYGTHPDAQEAAKAYESPEEYAEQGDTRVVRNLQFSYLAHVGDNLDGTPVLQPVDCPRDTELDVNNIGLIALRRGEKFHEFYTTRELSAIRSTGTATPITASTNVSDLGEHELAEWLATGKDGSAFTIDEVLETVGTDKDLANRMLAAENVRSDGDPRKGLEVGLTAIIEAENQ